MRVPRVIVVASVALSIALMTADAHPAESALLTAEMAPLTLPVRSGAPITVVWKLTSQSTGLLEGRLSLNVKDGHQRVARLITDEIVLTTGEQFQRTILPTLDTTHTINVVDIELRFVGKGQSIDLGTFSTLRLPNPWQRAHVIAVCDPWQRTLTAEKRKLIEQFRFESYNVNSSDKTVTTSAAHLPPDAMPSDPLGYFGFDVVLLMNEGFTELKEAQLQALATWVEAGGSLAIAPGPQTVRDEHRKFLSGLKLISSEEEILSNSLGQSAPAVSDASSPNSGRAPRIVLKRYGLGRVALIQERLDALGPSDLSDLRRMVGFLWKLRNDQRDRFVANALWDARLPESVTLTAENPNLPPEISNDILAQIRPRDMQLAPLPLQSGDQLLARLMPRDLRVVPLSFIAGMLVLYVLAIGPVDYWLLGALRRRRYTWLLFPAVTIGFAVGTITLSNWYMRVADNRRSVTFLDIGEAGKIARRNRLELLFRGAQGEVVSEVLREHFAALNHQQFTRGSWYNYQVAVQRGTENLLDLVAIPEYRGRAPVRYSVSQYMPQWTPQLNRRCSVAPDESEPPIPCDWNAVASLNPLGPNQLISEEIRRRLVDEIHRAFGADAGIYVATGAGIQHIAGPAGILQQDDPKLYSNDPNFIQSQQAYYQRNQRQLSTFLLDICSGNSQGGLFRVISQISPHGGDNFEDLALLDPSDSRQWLLVVTVDRGDELVVYRKLYTGE